MTNGQFWIYTLAVLLSPVIAVQVTQYLKKWGEERHRRVEIFRALMRTRMTGLAPDHVHALNLIDVEFFGNKNVIDAWRSYLEHLNSDAAAPGWGPAKDDLFTTLLSEIAEEVGFSLDRAVIRRTAYFPRGHGDLEQDQFRIRKSLIETLEGRRALPVETRAPSDEKQS